MTVRRLFVALFAIALFTMAVRETLDPDMWWHLRTGQLILEEGIPQQDTFSYTVRHHEWITHEWLSQVIMWSLYRLGGLPLLMVAFALMTAVTFWLLYLRCDGRPYLAAFVVLLAAIASALVWGVRPQIFNLLLTAAFVYLVDGYRQGQGIGRRALWALPVLTALWANLHSGYLLGVVLLATYTAGEAGRLWLPGFKPGALKAGDIGWLGLMTVLSFLAAVLNPSGVELWIYPFLTLGSNAMQSYIQEWQSPNFHLPFFWPYAFLLALGVVGWLVGRRRPSPTDLLLFGGTAAAGLLSARHIPLFAVVAAPIVARAWAAALDAPPWRTIVSGAAAELPTPRFQRWLNGALLGLALLVSLLWTGVKIGNNEAAVARRYPVAAVAYLQESGLAAQRVYNSYNWGGYLIWHDIPVFVDGRADVYGDDFLFLYRRTFDLRDNWAEPLDQFNVDYILMERGSPLTTLLAVADGWQEVYQDENAQIFRRVVD